MAEHEKNGKMLRNIVIGGLIGAAWSLRDSGTRRQVRGKLEKWSESSRNAWHTLKKDPAAFGAAVRDWIEQVREVTEEINDDVKEVIRQLDELKKSSEKTVQSAKKAKAELKEIGGRLKEPADRLTEPKQASENTDAHQQL